MEEDRILGSKAPLGGDTLVRLAVCAVAAAGVVCAAEKLCAGKGYPLWEKYGPWLLENKLQAIALLAAVLYALWGVLAPASSPPEEPEGFTACP